MNELYTDATVILAEGARIAIISCKKCGAAIILDDRESEPYPWQIHEKWHEEQPNDDRR